MSENTTQKTEGSRTFEQRTVARFAAVETRIERLEMKEFDTKPIWERALAAIEETNLFVREGFAQIHVEIATLNRRLDAIEIRLDAMEIRLDAMDKRFDAMDARFSELSIALDDGLRGVGRKMDVLNDYFLESRADQRYIDRRLEKLESQSKPS